jgi:hypothetical protein
MIKTPTIAAAAIDPPDLSALNTPTPPATTIPLTKKKVQPSQQGPVPTAIGPSGVISVEIETVAGGERARMTTPKLPGLPLHTGTPILLTKKKARQTPTTTIPANAAASATTGRDPDPAATQLTPQPVPHDLQGGTPAPRRVELRMATPPDGHGTFTGANGASADSKPEATKRKRTTLPLGLDHDRERPQTATGWGPSAAPSPPPPALPTHGPHIGGVMISVAPPPRTSISGPIPVPLPLASDRPTPKVAIDAQEGEEGAWMDAETAPGVTSGSR